MPKIELENFVEYGQLFEIYGKLLSFDRQKICEEYFSFNMTIAEISDEKKISRQAVFDAIHKSCEKLEEFEKTLGILQNRRKLTDQLETIAVLAQDSPKIKEKVEKILKEI